jgi:hypothetical protein
VITRIIIIIIIIIDDAVENTISKCLILAKEEYMMDCVLNYTLTYARK